MSDDIDSIKIVDSILRFYRLNMPFQIASFALVWTAASPLLMTDVSNNNLKLHKTAPYLGLNFIILTVDAYWNFNHASLLIHPSGTNACTEAKS